MNGWIAFWEIVCIVVFSAFYLIVLLAIPLGFRDLLRLFRHLNAGGESTEKK